MCYRWNEQCEWFQKQASVSDLFAQKLATFFKDYKNRKDKGLKKFVIGSQPLRYREKYAVGRLYCSLIGRKNNIPCDQAGLQRQAVVGKKGVNSDALIPALLVLSLLVDRF
ncbi:hypothetical protein AVEN_18828-1 [Araneus ventricosus]|uniref:Uncharacterized protein n=1 Tax=Araneus ventricosus TaxID=182803 RepID=A0A4Y2BWZ5_ARAVE|nr:hypothetical protein AVEN_18828-1 [Araneus ventricosus]